MTTAEACSSRQPLLRQGKLVLALDPFKSRVTSRTIVPVAMFKTIT